MIRRKDGASFTQIGKAAALRSLFKAGSMERNALNQVVHSSDIDVNHYNKYKDFNCKHDDRINDLLREYNSRLRKNDRIKMSESVRSRTRSSRSKTRSRKRSRKSSKSYRSRRRKRRRISSPISKNSGSSSRSKTDLNISL